MLITAKLKNLYQSIRKDQISHSQSLTKELLTQSNKNLFLNWLIKNKDEYIKVKSVLSHLLIIARYFTKKMEGAADKHTMKRFANLAKECYSWLDDGIFEIPPNLLNEYEEIMHQSKFYLKEVAYQYSALLINSDTINLNKEELEKHLTKIKAFYSLVQNKYKAKSLQQLLIIPSSTDIEAVIGKAIERLMVLEEAETELMDSTSSDNDEEFIPQTTHAPFQHSLIIADVDGDEIDRMDCSDNDNLLIPASCFNSSTEKSHVHEEPDSTTEEMEENSETEEDGEEARLTFNYAANVHAFWQHAPQSTAIVSTSVERFMLATDQLLYEAEEFIPTFTSIAVDFFLFERDDTLKANNFKRDCQLPFISSLQKIRAFNNIDHALAMPVIREFINHFQDNLAASNYSDAFDRIMDNLINYIANKITKNSLLGKSSEYYSSLLKTHYQIEPCAYQSPSINY